MTLPRNSPLSCPLVFACDAGYAMPLATTLRSVAEANRKGWPLNIYVLSSGFSEELKRRVADSLPKGSSSIHWLGVDLTAFEGFSTLRHISAATYARLLIASVLPEHIHKVLYLDADILVLHDFTALREQDLEGAVLGAVRDVRLDADIKSDKTTIAGLPRVRDYFNAAVLVIDVDRWRAERISEKALEYLDRYPHSPYSDQDALNAACDGLWKQLDRWWNWYQVDLERPLSQLSPAERPGIIHFHGSRKPWDAKSLNVHAGFYDSFRTRTQFARTPEERWRERPLLMWSRFKQVLKRSAVLRYAWNQLRSRQSSEGPNTARRLSA